MPRLRQSWQVEPLGIRQRRTVARGRGSARSTTPSIGSGVIRKGATPLRRRTLPGELGFGGILGYLRGGAGMASAFRPGDAIGREIEDALEDREQ